MMYICTRRIQTKTGESKQIRENLSKTTMRKVIALMMFTLIALTAGAQTTQKKVYNEQSTPMGQNNKAEDNSVIAVGYPDE